MNRFFVSRTLLALLWTLFMGVIGSADLVENPPAQVDQVCDPGAIYPPNSAYNPCEFPEFFEGEPPQRQPLAAETLDHPDLNVAYIQQQPRYDYTTTKNQHAPGDPVSFVATIANRGAQPTGEFAYAWQIDGLAVAQGTHPSLQPDEMAQVTFGWVWETGPHTVSLTLDPANSLVEVSELNNEVTDRTNALAVGFWVERSVYEWFNDNQVYLGLGSVSWDDWAQRQLAHWNQMFVEAVSPLTPEGIVERVRLDKVTILEDGAYPNCANTFWPEDKTVDLVWGFISESVGVPSGHTCSTLNFYQIYPQFQVLELPLLHEMTHARYLIDLYGLNLGLGAAFLSTSVDNATTTLPVTRDVTNALDFPLPAYLAVGGELIVCQTRAGMAFSNCTRGADGTLPRSHNTGTVINLANVRIQDGAGNLVQGSSALPLVGNWQDHLYYNRYEAVDLMGSGGGYGQHSAYAWNRIAGQRPICGNYNAPCNIGEYLNEIPAANLLEIRDLNGNPLEGAHIEMYYARPVAVWYGKYF
ncbi:MAG: hypothetical protein HUU38_09055, partial [Anaerolineales bacterium]|nr:hypothetical protein [Anaerolineales bacterium]